MSNAKYDVVAIGNAIVDVLSMCDDALIEKLGLRKGTMILIDEDRAEELYELMGPATECSGGAAANTLAGLASLGGRAAFVGKVRNDTLGHIFTHDMRATGVYFDTPHAEAGKATARCLIFVTPDAQRTMNTYIGACATLPEQDIDAQLIADSALLMVEGYMWNDPTTKAAIRRAMEIAKAADRQIAFSPSDVFCIENHHQEMLELVEESDVVFANEMEAKTLYGVETFEEAAEAIRGKCKLAVITRGELGSVVITPEHTVAVSAAPVHEVVDTTGAGDLFASGFLYGYLRGWEPAKCAELGSQCSAEIIQHMGARTLKPLSRFVNAA
ncbi:MAG: adenosine kinase [Rickettsiales bacterium]